MDVARAWRIATGAMLLAAGASGLLPPATSYVALAFGGALFGAALGAPTTVIRERERSTDAPAAALKPAALEIRPMKPSGAHATAIAAGAALGASLLFAYPLVVHRGAHEAQLSSAGIQPHNTIGRAVPPRIDPQLHEVGLGRLFAISRARIAIGAASLCRTGGNVRVHVPAAVSQLRSGVSVSEPEYQLLDAQGDPHQPTGTVPIGLRRASNGHAVPPPAVYHEWINFELPAGSAKGTLKLQAVLPSGSGPEYRVTVLTQNSRRSSRIEGLTTACISPGGQGV